MWADLSFMSSFNGVNFVINLSTRPTTTTTFIYITFLKTGDPLAKSKENGKRKGIMKFSIDRSPLLEGLQKVQSVVEKRNTIQILGNILC